MRAVRVVLASSLVFVGFGALGCQTQFYGSAMFPGGPEGCWKQCEEDGMEMGSFVYVGEYSSGCVCRRRRVKKTAARADQDFLTQASAAVGVAMQARRVAAESQQH